jgi:hypothetical protein
MPCDTSRLGVVDFDSCLRSDLCLLDIEETTRSLAPGRNMFDRTNAILDIMRRYMQKREDQHGISDLAMEPDVLVQRQKLDLWSNPSHQCTTNWE